MKKVALLLFLAVFHQFAHAQIIQLRFSATVNGAHGALDSVTISNLTNPGDTVLHWPDTTILLGYVGIQQPAGLESSEFSVRLASANPCADRAIVQVFVPTSGDVELKITDISGRLLHKTKKYLSKGSHSFLYYPDKQGISFVSAVFNSMVKSVKIVFSGAQSGNAMLDYLGDGHTAMSPKSLASSLSFAFVVGDSLLIKGWWHGQDTTFYDTPLTSSDYAFSFINMPPCPGLPQFTYGGETYHTIQIGNQCLMRENLNIGTMIMGISDQSNDSILQKYCFNDDSANCAIYGGLYQWAEMMQYTTSSGAQGICPAGWHIPSSAEWDTLVSFLGGEFVAGGKMKEYGVTHWFSPSIGATNESGFSALGAGLRYNNGSFDYFNIYASFWSSTEVFSNNGYFEFMYYANMKSVLSSNYKTYGYSVRCFKD